MGVKKKSGNGEWKIVIVEDSPTQAEQLKCIIETHGYHVVAASNGREALALLRSDKPNLVISDIVMPEMDGYELCKQIKTDEKLKDVPVILLTALSDPADVIRGLECGADNFLTKPYDERVLLSRTEYLRLNWRLPESKQVQMGVEITFSGQKYFITSDRLQILNLLLSTYEAAVSKNRQLVQAQGELRRLNEQLEQRVKARTAELVKTNEKLRLEITERKQMQIQLVQTEKMSAVGTLAAGLAHELNNPLMAMLNFSQYCLKHSSQDDRRYSVLQDIEHETRRCIDIVHNLLTFSHMEKENEASYQKASFAAVLDWVLKLLSYRVERQRVLVTQHTGEGTPDVPMVVNKMQQVFLNIVSNALDALGESEKKEIHIDVRRDGEFVQVVIADTGCGIGPENLTKVFDPFFTTKPAGQGTGLGLSTSRALVEAHGGEITCESEAGGGTTVKVSLPVERRKGNE
jgi:two-component system sensor histidine kinase/response regulator